MGGSSICISGDDPESKPLSTVEIIVDCSVATQQVMLEFCETVGIVGYLSSRDDTGGTLHCMPPPSPLRDGGGTCAAMCHYCATEMPARCRT